MIFESNWERVFAWKRVTLIEGGTAWLGFVYRRFAMPVELSAGGHYMPHPELKTIEYTRNRRVINF